MGEGLAERLVPREGAVGFLEVLVAGVWGGFTGEMGLLLSLLAFLAFFAFLVFFTLLVFSVTTSVSICVAQQATGGDAPLIKSGDAFGSMFWSHEGWGGVRYRALVVSGLLGPGSKGVWGENGGLNILSSSSDIFIFLAHHLTRNHSLIAVF